MPDDELPALEQRIDDLRAVMQAAGSQRAALLGFSEGGNMAVLFAASHPDRTLALATFGCFAKRIWSPDYPWAPTPEQREREYEHIEREWGGLMDLSRLPAIRVPTLVMHRSGDLDCNIEEGRYLARHIPGARFIEYPGDDHVPWVGDQDAVLDDLLRFFTGARPVREIDRVLATVLFISGQAQPGEVLVSSTVKDLVSGSGLHFEDCGTPTLKGVPGEWRVYSAR